MSEDLGGPEHDLLGFTMQSHPTTPAACGTLAESLARTTALEIGGVKLGMSRRRVEEVVGPLQALSDGRLTRSFEYRVKMTEVDIARFRRAGEPLPYPYYDVEIYIESRFVNNELVEFTVWKTATT